VINSILTNSLALANQGAEPAAVAGETILYAFGGQTKEILPSGLRQAISGAGQVKVTATTVAGATGQIAVATVNANDMVAGAVYELIAGGNGTFGNPVGIITFGAALNGAVIGIANGPAAAAMGAGQNFRWAAIGRFICTVAGASGSLVGWVEFQFTQIANNILPGTAADNTIPGVAGAAASVAVNTTVSNTLGITVNDAGGTGATLTALAGYLKRVA
jgi:hypothetical protein